MENSSLYVGLVLKKKNNTLWRIIFTGTTTNMIEMNTEKTNIIIMDSFDLKNSIALGEFLIAGETEQDKFFFDVKVLTENQKKDYEKKKAFINDIKNTYGPDYIDFCSKTRDYTFPAIYIKYQYSHTLAYRLVRRWLQSGMQDGSWMDPRLYRKAKAKAKRNYHKKTGIVGTYSNGIPLTEEVREHFDYGVNLYKKIRNMTKTDSYRIVIKTYYSTPNEDGSRTLFDEGSYPTIRQYLHYLSNQISEVDILRIKTSNDEFNNSYRLLSGFNRASAIKPGYILEADAVEVGFHTVSMFNNQQNVSKPIVYMLADLYSHAIVACHVSYNNNDMIALSSLMMNLFEDKSIFLKTHNIENIDLSYWPSRFIPHEIRCDRGSDFASEQFLNICQRLNIVRTLEHGATGSMKGLIERSFGQFQAGIRPFLEDKGIVQYRYDSMHKKQACMTLEHVLQLVIMFIIEHNRHYFEKWNLTPDMRKQGVEKTPISVWNYGIENEGNTEPITNHNYMSVLFALMPESTATITREGIKFRNLIYRVPENSILATRCIASKINGAKRDTSGKKLNSLDIRYDPRSIDNIYVLENNQILSLMNAYDKNGQYRHCTWEDYEEMCIREKENAVIGRRNNLTDSINRIESIVNLSQTACMNTYANTTDVHRWRKLDKNAVNFANRIEVKMNEDISNPKVNTLSNAVNEIQDSTNENLTLKTSELSQEEAVTKLPITDREYTEDKINSKTQIQPTSKTKITISKKKKIVKVKPENKTTKKNIVTGICPEELCDFD